MKSKFILDPLWITQGSYLDEEYFNYVLLDASLKYKKEISENSLDRFYEVLFHVLNLNNLAVNGSLHTPKFKEILDNPRIEQIRSDLKKIYEIQEDTVGIFKNANFVFLNIVLEYIQIHLDILNKIKLFYMNREIHLEKEIFIVINTSSTHTYNIWKLIEDKRRNFGYSLSRIAKLELPEVKENMLKYELEKLDNPKLTGIAGNVNLFFAIAEDGVNETQVANAIKDIAMINKGIAKDADFEPLILDELYKCVWFEKMIPFTLDQWVLS